MPWHRRIRYSCVVPDLILIAGPCGVGKSTVSELIASETGFPLENLDDARRKYESTDPYFRLSFFDLQACVRKLAPNGRAVIDIGGDTMFRTGAAALDNLDMYRDQVEKLKAASGCAVIVLDAPEAVLRSRFQSCKPQRATWFDAALTAWATAKPYWEELADFVIDTDASTRRRCARLSWLGSASSSFSDQSGAIPGSCVVRWFQGEPVRPLIEIS